MSSTLSRLETAVSNVDLAGFFIGYAVSESDAASISYNGTNLGQEASDGSVAKRARIDEEPDQTSADVGNEVCAGDPSILSDTPDHNERSPAPDQHLDDHDINETQERLQKDSDQESKLTEANPSDQVSSSHAMQASEAVQVKPEPVEANPGDNMILDDVKVPTVPTMFNNRREKEVYDSEQMLNLHDTIHPLKSADQFCCGGRFILNETDRLVRVRFDSGEKDLKDAGSVCQLAVADLLRGHVKASPLNPSQEPGDHVAHDLASDFRLSIHASASTKPADDATFLEEIRQRCCDVFNIPSLSLRRRHLRIYSKGGYCRPSMSSPRVPQRTIATVVVCLPSPFTGGKLVVSHLKTRKSFSFADRSASRDSIQWAAFYSDCEYEIKRVRSGYQALVIYDACVEGDEPVHRRQVYKQVVTRALLTPPFDEISSLVESVTSFLSNAPVVGLFTWYSYTLSALNKAPMTLKGLDRYIYDSLSAKFRIVLLPVIVRLPYEDDSSRNIRIAAFTRDDIEYMEGVADKPPHDELELFEGAIPFPLRSDIETFEFCSNDEVETTYFYSAMVIFPNGAVPIAEA